MPLPSDALPSPSTESRVPRRVVLATGIYPPEAGGPATYVRALAQWMYEHGWQPTVITYGDDRVPQDGWRVVSVSRRGGPVIRYLRYAVQVWRAARQADVVYVQGGVSDGFPGSVGAICAGKRRRIMMRVPGDYAWEMHQQKPGTLPQLLDEFIRTRHSGSTGILEALERWTARRARRIVTPSAYLKKIVTMWGAPAEKIQVIYSSVPSLPSAQPREMTRSANGWTDRYVLFTAVRAVPWKGVDFLLEMLRDLPERYVLCVAGEGPLLSTWQAMAVSYGLTSRVRFLGRVDRSTMANWYAAADLFLLASGYEGFPHVVVEAVSMGLPCVVSDCGGNPETKELFPGYVRVCPYQQRDAWKEACAAEQPRLTPLSIDGFSKGAERLSQLIDDVCVS